MTQTPGRRILLVEDNPSVAEGVEILLDLLGHEVTTVRDGPSGLAAARRLRPEVILTDIGLPGMDGIQLARALRDEGFDATRIVALSGSRPEDDDEETLTIFDRWLVKPVGVEALEAELAR